MPGVVRGVVLEEAQKAGIETELAPVDSKELFASALFLTNSLIGLRPAAKAGGRAPGGADMAKIAELKSRYEAAMKADLDAFGAAR